MNPRANRPDWRLVGGFAALTILIHFLTNGAYGYFRDELRRSSRSCWLWAPFSSNRSMRADGVPLSAMRFPP
ncbi:MAG TPA: hypothetical protein VJX68_18815 [Candidatus Binatus sp.]|uniref:hypothetical protein n=1 Tax=Candidatus Binatus sp. TaxID=2811406 RepID=UPI002B478FE1|nr:hypothetical protein [Candidatus Binatus sp.]HKN15248.1 hypothetical protein [Candidatus Binatus sp.]